MSKIVLAALLVFVPTIGCVDVNLPDPQTDEASFPNGDPCVRHEQCESRVCIPERNDRDDPTQGVCFSLSWYGCVDVGPKSPIFATCSDSFERLFVCGRAYPVQTLGDCVSSGFGTIGEEYQCCIF